MGVTRFKGLRPSGLNGFAVEGLRASGQLLGYRVGVCVLSGLTFCGGRFKGLRSVVGAC